jgi:hypothetical protein
VALLDSEVARVKIELGYNLLNVGAIPYVGITALFEQIVQPYLSSGAITTSSTTVTASGSAAVASLTLANPTGFSLFDRVIVDVDGQQEAATVRRVNAGAIDLLLSGSHSGTYPVTVEAGEAVVRETLKRIDDVKSAMAGVLGEGSLKKVDEIEFYQNKDSLFGSLGVQLSFWRDELAAALGIQSMWKARAAAGQRMAVY